MPKIGCALGVNERASAVGLMKSMLVKSGSIVMDSAAAEVVHSKLHVTLYT